MKFYVSILAMSMTAVACGPSHDDRVDALWAKTMEVHDEVMAHQTDVVEVQKRAELSLNDTTLSEREKSTIDSIRLEASAAEEAMMDWMVDAGEWTGERKQMTDSVEINSLIHLHEEMKDIEMDFKRVIKAGATLPISE